MNQHFRDNPKDWKEYHKIAEENESSYEDQSEVPYMKVISYLEGLKGKSKKIVADLGCGKARVSKHFSNKSRFTFLNFDHHSCNKSVIEKDISNTGLEDDSVNIAVLSLALWGSNCKDYIKEAYRILEDEGALILIEPSSRWIEELDDGIKNKLEDIIKECGFKTIECDLKKFMFIRSVKV